MKTILALAFLFVSAATIQAAPPASSTDSDAQAALVLATARRVANLEKEVDKLAKEVRSLKDQISGTKPTARADAAATAAVETDAKPTFAMPAGTGWQWDGEKQTWWKYGYPEGVQAPAHNGFGINLGVTVGGCPNGRCNNR